MSRLLPRARLIVALIMVVAASSVAMPQAGAAQGNHSLLFYRYTGTPNAYRSTLSNGTYAGKGPSNLAKGWSQIAISRDSVLLYNSSTGAGASGTFINGVYTKKASYSFSPGWEYVVAGCDTALFFDLNTQTSAEGTLKNGIFTQMEVRHWTNVTAVAASCDTLLAYNYTGGGALTLPMTGGQVLGTGTVYHFSPKWLWITATDDSVLFYNQGTGVGAWGRLIAGTFTQTGSSTGFSKGITNIAGTSDTLFFYTLGSSTAGISTLKSGVYQFVGSTSSLSNNWAIIEGAK